MIVVKHGILVFIVLMIQLMKKSIVYLLDMLEQESNFIFDSILLGDLKFSLFYQGLTSSPFFPSFPWLALYIIVGILSLFSFFSNL